MELNEILSELSVFGSGSPLPAEALAEAARQREAITPALLEALDAVYKTARDEGEGVCDNPAYDLSWYGIFLLSQFQEQRAFPVLLRMLELDTDRLDWLLGDSFPDYMPKALYSTYNGDLAALQSVIRNSALDPFARGAALETLDGLLCGGRLSREELAGFLREQLDTLGEGESEEIFGAMLVSLIADCDLFELAEDVREAYRKEKIDLMSLGGFDSFFDHLYNETGENGHVRRIDDAVRELSQWDCFQSSEPEKTDILSWKAGRNDPCPCGSGKKFKKCCLPVQEELKAALSAAVPELREDRYPPVERQGERPGLSDFYSREAIEVDRLAYRALRMLERPGFRQNRERRRAFSEAKRLLWEAFEQFREICRSGRLDSPEAYDREHRLHYFSREWLEVLGDMLEDSGDGRCQEVRAALHRP